MTLRHSVLGVYDSLIEKDNENIQLPIGNNGYLRILREINKNLKSFGNSLKETFIPYFVEKEFKIQYFADSSVNFETIKVEENDSLEGFSLENKQFGLVLVDGTFLDTLKNYEKLQLNDIAAKIFLVLNFDKSILYCDKIPVRRCNTCTIEGECKSVSHFINRYHPDLSASINTAFKIEKVYNIQDLEKSFSTIAFWGYKNFMISLLS